jgi:hypothetical protein
MMVNRMTSSPLNLQSTTAFAARWLASKLANISQAIPTMDPNEVSFGRFGLDLSQRQLVREPTTLSSAGQGSVKAERSHETTREIPRNGSLVRAS